MTTPEGRVNHAEVKIGDSIVMMGEPTGESKPMPGMIYLYLEDTDAAYNRALDAGATSGGRTARGNAATHESSASSVDRTNRSFQVSTLSL